MKLTNPATIQEPTRHTTVANKSHPDEFPSLVDSPRGNYPKLSLGGTRARFNCFFRNDGLRWERARSRSSRVRAESASLKQTHSDIERPKRARLHHIHLREVDSLELRRELGRQQQFQVCRRRQTQTQLRQERRQERALNLPKIALCEPSRARTPRPARESQPQSQGK